MSAHVLVRRGVRHRPVLLLARLERRTPSTAGDLRAPVRALPRRTFPSPESLAMFRAPARGRTATPSPLSGCANPHAEHRAFADPTVRGGAPSRCGVVSLPLATPHRSPVTQNGVSR